MGRESASPFGAAVFGKIQRHFVVFGWKPRVARSSPHLSFKGDSQRRCRRCYFSFHVAHDFALSFRAASGRRHSEAVVFNRNTLLECSFSLGHRLWAQQKPGCSFVGARTRSSQLCLFRLTHSYCPGIDCRYGGTVRPGDLGYSHHGLDVGGCGVRAFS
ncbi:hypothetical protein D3C87_1738350 [compost metagenome]